jgi:hypothetical protein
MDKIATEVLLNVLAYVHLGTLLQCSLVDRRLALVCSSDSVWKQLFLCDAFPIPRTTTLGVYLQDAHDHRGWDYINYSRLPLESIVLRALPKLAPSQWKQVYVWWYKQHVLYRLTSAEHLGISLFNYRQSRWMNDLQFRRLREETSTTKNVFLTTPLYSQRPIDPFAAKPLVDFPYEPFGGLVHLKNPELPLGLVNWLSSSLAHFLHVQHITAGHLSFQSHSNIVIHPFHPHPQFNRMTKVIGVHTSFNHNRIQRGHYYAVWQYAHGTSWPPDPPIIHMTREIDGVVQFTQWTLSHLLCNINLL